MMEHLRALCPLFGPSGAEDEVRAYLLPLVRAYAERVTVDTMGNLLAFKKGRSSDKTVMVAAHMDEVGLIVTRIADDGTLKFGFVGGVMPAMALGQRVLIGPARRPGVIGIRAVHLSKKDERKTMPDADALYIDIGVKTAAEAEALVSPGDYGIFHSSFTLMGDGLIRAKAIDDRAGCAIMLSLMAETPACDTWFAFTAQEEVGTRGAAVAAFAVKPDIALILETTTAADLPDTPAHKKVCRLDGGAVISFMDNGTIYDAALFDRLTAIARAEAIKWQVKSLVSGGNDAAVIHRAGVGVRCANLSIPVRYLHAPFSVAARADCLRVQRLAQQFILTEGGLSNV